MKKKKNTSFTIFIACSSYAIAYYFWILSIYKNNCVLLFLYTEGGSTVGSGVLKSIIE